MLLHAAAGAGQTAAVTGAYLDGSSAVLSLLPCLVLTANNWIRAAVWLQQGRASICKSLNATQQPNFLHSGSVFNLVHLTAKNFEGPNAWPPEKNIWVVKTWKDKNEIKGTPLISSALSVWLMSLWKVSQETVWVIVTRHALGAIISLSWTGVMQTPSSECQWVEYQINYTMRFYPFIDLLKV